MELTQASVSSIIKEKKKILQNLLNNIMWMLFYKYKVSEMYYLVRALSWAGMFCLLQKQNKTNNLVNLD